MGLGGQAGHPDVTAACEKIYRAAIRKGIPAGHSTGYDPQGIQRWLGLGLSWIAVDGDWITLYRHAAEAARRIREIHSASNPGNSEVEKPPGLHPSKPESALPTPATR